MTSFVGRELSLANITDLLLARDEVRLVTLIGPGGVGKTRLALKVAERIRDRYPDGVWLVDLAPLEDPDLVDRTVAMALELVDGNSEPGLSKLIDELPGKQMLMVLDNCEHLVEPVRNLLLTLLQVAPGLHVLATSREKIAVRGEHLVPVPPLCTSCTDDPPEGEVAGEAVRLLIDRAGAVGASLTEPYLDDARQLCALLDGLPLAIELAAVRLGELTLTEVLEQVGALACAPEDEGRLDRRFALLVDGDQYEQRQHRTLEVTLEWSYQMLTPSEQRAWADVSVFAGGFDLDAAYAVCGSAGDVERDEILDLLTRLVRRSLLVRYSSAGRTRYRMLETIRQFGARLVDDEQRARLRRAHADHYRAMVNQAAADWLSPREIWWMHRIQRDTANLRVALSHYLGQPDQVHLGGEMLLALARSRAWTFTGMLGEQRHWFELATKADPPLPGPLKTGLLLQHAWTTLIHGHPMAAEPVMAQAVTALASPDMPDLTASLLFAQGTRLWLAEPDPARAVESIKVLAQAREAFQHAGDAGGAYMAGLFTAISAAFYGDRDVAIAESQQLLATATAHEAGWSISWAWWTCGMVELVHGSATEATTLMQRALQTQLDIGDTWGPLWSLWGLACAASHCGDHERAAQLFGAAYRLMRQMRVSIEGLHSWKYIQHKAEELTKAALGSDEHEAQCAVGRALVSTEVIALALREPTAPARSGGLTHRELQVTSLAATGLSVSEIAQTLTISPSTVRRHVESVYTKLDVHNRAQLTAWFNRQQGGAVSPGRAALRR